MYGVSGGSSSSMGDIMARGDLKMVDFARLSSDSHVTVMCLESLDLNYLVV